MKTLLFSLLILLSACQTNKKVNDLDHTNEDKNHSEMVETNSSNLPILTVTSIENGKDGYMATLKDDKNGLYTCTISIPNLADNYVRLNIGDKVKINGEYAESYPVQIFAKKIHVIKKATSEKLPELTVIKVIGEKDGETIHLIDLKKRAYNMIVSIPNLGNDYIHLKEGDKVIVDGEYIDSFPTQIFPKKIRKIN